MKKLLVFTAQWCGSCKMLKPILAALEFDGLINLQVVDIDDQRAHAAQMGVKSVPALFFYHGDIMYEQSVGFMPREKILEIYNREIAVQQSLDEFFDLEPEAEVEVEVEVVDSLGEDFEVDIVAEVEDSLLAIEPEVEGETFVDLEEVLPEPEEEVIFIPPHSIFDEQPEEELVVEDEDIDPLV